MAVEIERKFLVIGDAWRTQNPTRYSQGYLSAHSERTVRVRVAGDQAWLTVKGLSSGYSRAEFEYSIPVADAEQMLAICEQRPVEKQRHMVVHANKRWEVDEFLGANAGLIVAEIELESESEQFEQPPWLGEEVTADPRYFNSQLAAQPFATWPHAKENP